MLLRCDLSMNNLSLWIAVFNLMEFVGVVCANLNLEAWFAVVQ
jgi:hypothetical protein